MPGSFIYPSTRAKTVLEDLLSNCVAETPCLVHVSSNCSWLAEEVQNQLWLLTPSGSCPADFCRSPAVPPLPVIQK